MGVAGRPRVAWAETRRQVRQQADRDTPRVPCLSWCSTLGGLLPFLLPLRFPTLHTAADGMAVDVRHGSILAMAAVGLGVCLYKQAKTDLPAASESPRTRDALWGAPTPREPNQQAATSSTPPKQVQAPGTPVRASKQEQLWGQAGSEGRPSPRPTRTILSRSSGAAAAAASAIAGVVRASHKLYIGCYSEKQWWVEGQPGEGLYVFDFDAETGGLALDQIERTVVSPSWSVVHPSGKYLFVVTEKGPDDSEADSFVTCYRIAASGTLTYLSKQLTGGTGGNCITVVGDSAVVCTNYFTGSLASFPFDPQTGALGTATVTPHVQKATGPIADRQEAAHPHDLFVKGNQLFVPDLGMDQVLGYAVDTATGAGHSMHSCCKRLRLWNDMPESGRLQWLIAIVCCADSQRTSARCRTVHRATSHRQAPVAAAFSHIPC